MAVTPAQKKAYLERLANDPEFRETVKRKQDRAEDLRPENAEPLTPANTPAAQELRRLMEKEFGTH